MMEVNTQRSKIEKVSEDGVFWCAVPDLLMSIKRIVINSDILPGIKSGGIIKLEEYTLYWYES